MIVSSTKVQNNFGEYLKLAEKEDIIITRNGKKVARLVKYRKGDDYIIREGSSAYSHAGMEVSYQEFLRIAEESENRYEYIDGKIYLLSSPSYKHQKIVREILTYFSGWFRDKDCEPLDSPFDVTLYKDEKNINVVQPDILVICDQENIDEDENRYMGIPSLVVEVLSKSTRNNDFIRKLDLYRASGVEEYWIINPFAEEINIYIFANEEIKEMKTYKEDKKVKSSLFTGLEIKLNNIFA